MKILHISPHKTTPTHFYSLDAIRGIAAIIVVLYHWQLFYYANDVFTIGGYDKLALPGYRSLSFFYEYGMLAVEIFFLLSGFVFFWLYAERIASGKLSTAQFFGYRISRLYPIHIVTLLAVMVLQWMMVQYEGHTFIIEYNDVYHFILNLFFMQNWGFEKGASFNGPSWSVSVEVFLYILFFIICRLKLQRKLWLFALLIPVGALVQHFYAIIGKGIYSFFLGALIYYLYSWILNKGKIRQFLPPVVGVTVLLWAAILLAFRFSILQSIWIPGVKQSLPGEGQPFLESLFHVTGTLFFRSVVSPLTVLSLALWETGRGMLQPKWAVLGNSSYAMYLIHFPLMIIFVLITDHLGFSRTLYQSPYMMLLFFALLIPLSMATYYYFEFPVQEKIREQFFRKEKRRVVIPDTPAVTGKIS